MQFFAATRLKNGRRGHFNHSRMSKDKGKSPKVVLEKIVMGPLTVLAIADTAVTVADIGRLLNRDYEELFVYIGREGLVPGRVMVFYHSAGEPFAMDVAVEVNRVPDRLTGRIEVKRIEKGEAIVAHYQGPYESIHIAYESISAWLRENEKDPRGYPFETYLNDPSSVKDTYELRTDLYQPVQ